MSTEAELLFSGQWAWGVSDEAGGGGVKVINKRACMLCFFLQKE